MERVGRSRSLVMLLHWSWLSSRDFVNHSTDRWKSSMRVYVCVKIDTTFAICLAYFPAIFGVGYGRKGDGKCVLMVVECWHTRSQIQYPIFSYLTKTRVSTITPHVIYPFWFENVKSRLLKESRRILLRWNSSSIKQAYYYCKMKFQYCPEIDQTISNFDNRTFSSCLQLIKILLNSKVLFSTLLLRM